MLGFDLCFSQAAMQTSMQLSKPDTFILAPVSAQARLKRNRAELPLKSRSQPRIVCDLILETLQFSITEVIYLILKTLTKLLFLQFAHLEPSGISKISDECPFK
jgi:Vacuolar sorting-associated protein 13, N-terminal